MLHLHGGDRRVKPGYWSRDPERLSTLSDDAGARLYPVSVAEVKAQLRVETDDDDALLSSYIATATDKLDGWHGTLGKCLMTQSWRATYARLCGAPWGLRLPVCPVQSVAEITYYDASGAVQTLDPALYCLSSRIGMAYITPVHGAVWPETQIRDDAVSVVVSAGYGGQDDVPRPICQAIILDVIGLYDMSADRAAIDRAISGLIGPYGVKI